MGVYLVHKRVTASGFVCLVHLYKVLCLILRDYSCVLVFIVDVEHQLAENTHIAIFGFLQLHQYFDTETDNTSHDGKFLPMLHHEIP